MQTEVESFESQSDSDKELTCLSIAKFLLHQRYVLTAFELLHELLEDGQLKAASKLQDYFGDQEMFPPDQMIQLQSLKALDTQRLYDEKDVIEKKLALSEQELQNARDEIQVLQKRIEQGLETFSPMEGLTDVDIENNTTSLKKAISKRAVSHKGEVIEPQERKVLNFAVKEYLVSAGYKLTAMTFYDEVDDQNLDEWPEGKIRVEKTLRTYYHHFYTCIADEDELIDLREKNKSLKEDLSLLEQEENTHLKELNELKKKLLEKDHLVQDLEKEKQRIENESIQFKSELKVLESKLEELEKERKVYLNAIHFNEENAAQLVGNEAVLEDSHPAPNSVNNIHGAFDLDKEPSELVTQGNSNVDRDITALNNTDVVRKKENDVDVYEKNETDEIVTPAPAGVAHPEKEGSDEQLTAKEILIKPGGEHEQYRDNHTEVRMVNVIDDEDNNGIIREKSVTSTNSEDYYDNDDDRPNAAIGNENAGSQQYEHKDEDKPLEEKGAINSDGSDANIKSYTHGEYCVHIIAESLPKIIPNVLINFREELLPLIICAIERHPDPVVRDQLTHSLFNLIKKPNEEQREVIMNACVDLASKIGEERTETELLPQCWEQVMHKLPERRLLVSLSCSKLAPFVKHEIRTSLILSILQQLCDDPDTVVRESVAKNLSLLIPMYSNGDKYSKIEELIFRLISDESTNVTEQSLKSLFPIFVKWTKSVKHPLSQLIKSILLHLFENIRSCPTFASENSFESNLRVLDDSSRQKVISILRMLASIMHEVFNATIRTWPDSLKPEVLAPQAESDQSVENKDPSENALRNVIDDESDPFPLSALERYSKSDLDWLAFDWLPHHCIPTLLKFACMLQQREESVRIKLCDVFLTMTQLFGFNYSNTIILPVFLIALDDVTNISFLPPKILNHVNDLRPVNASESKLSKTCILPILFAGVLASPALRDRRNTKDTKMNRSLSDYLRYIIISSCLKSGALNLTNNFDLIDSIRFLCTYDSCHSDVLSVLWDLVVNPTPSVRISASVIFQSIIAYMDETNVRQKVVPALVTLASDPNIEVKHASISAFGSVAQHFKNESIVEKIKIQMDTFLEDGSHDALILVFKTLTASLPLASYALKEYLLQKLNVVASRTQTDHIHSVRKRQRNEVLCSAVRALEASELSPSLIRDLLLPSIQALLRDSDALDASDREILESILKERGGSKFEVFTKTLFGKERSFYPAGKASSEAGESQSNESPSSSSPGAGPPPEESRFRRMMRAKYEDMVKRGGSVKSSGRNPLI